MTEAVAAKLPGLDVVARGAVELKGKGAVPLVEVAAVREPVATTA